MLQRQEELPRKIEAAFNPPKAQEYIHHNAILCNTVSSTFLPVTDLDPSHLSKKGLEGTLNISYKQKLAHTQGISHRRVKHGIARLFANGSQGVLTGEHHRGTAGTKPGIVVGSFGADDATNGHEQTTEGTGQHGMDRLQREDTYPKVAPDPSMYLPRVRMTPLGPAPYWKIVTVPVIYERHCPAEPRKLH